MVSSVSMPRFKLPIVLILAVVSTMGSQEPQNDGDCSRFVYEYKIMERLVRLELDKQAMQTRIAELESQVAMATNGSLTKAAPLVAVKVGLSKPITVVAGGQIVYDRVISNVGGAYNNTAGLFVAPVPGVYSFAASLCIEPAKWMLIGVVKNWPGNIISQLMSGDNGYHGCNSDYTTSRLAAGDKVWVEKLRGVTDNLNEEYGLNYFSANLVQPE